MTQPNPSDMTLKIIAAHDAAKSASDLPIPGTFAREYGDLIKGDLTPENIEAFIHGTSVLGLLAQEAILRATSVSKMTKPENDEHATYLSGALDGAVVVARIMGMVADDLIQYLAEGPVVDREFNNIVNNF
jgi:hypothetical protein